MIDDLDEVLRQLLIRDLPIKNGEVDVKFDQPKREWSARVSRPTLNLFLYDMRENQKLRQAQPMWDVQLNPDGTVSQRRKPVRLDLHYMITAWATEPEDEHRLLGRTLMALFRHLYLPAELLPESLQHQPAPISMMVAQYDELRNPTDVWNVLDNEMRPAAVLIVTLAMDPYQPTVTPLVRTRELRIGPSPVPPSERLEEGIEPDRFWTIGGTLRSAQPLDAERVRLLLVERGQVVPLQPAGDGQPGMRFAIGRLAAGAYTLEVSVEGREPRRFPISVPAADYDLEV
jgi:Pvc16 N-terminal domain